MSKIDQVACVGSGVIGTSWALGFSWRGLKVSVYDIDENQIAKAKETMQAYLDTLSQQGLLSSEEVGQVKERVFYTTDLAAAMEGAQFIQESGPEDYGIKQEILRQIEDCVSDDTVIASSTSGLLITEIAKTMRHPERLIGGHPYNPPHLIPLVEIVRGEKSSDAAVQTAKEFYTMLGKEPVVLNKEVSGYIANRLQVALQREIMDLVVNGVCSIEDADKAMLWGPGLRWGCMGPNLIFHLGAGEDGGLRAILEKQRDSINLRLSDMADWKEMPDAFFEMADEGIQEEIDHLPDEYGKSIPELSRTRDSMLIRLLQMHGKI